MKKIEAIVRPERLEDVKRALEDAGAMGLSVTEIKGRGRQGGVTRLWRGHEYMVDLLPKVKVELVVPDDMRDPVVEAIMSAARTGSVGDGKIFVLPVDEVIRVRTGERGQNAIGNGH